MRLQRRRSAIRMAQGEFPFLRFCFWSSLAGILATNKWILNCDWLSKAKMC